jgi:hypothetical protein
MLLDVCKTYYLRVQLIHLKSPWRCKFKFLNQEQASNLWGASKRGNYTNAQESSSSRPSSSLENKGFDTLMNINGPFDEIRFTRKAHGSKPLSFLKMDMKSLPNFYMYVIQRAF